jgi:hypothetical protein
VLARDPSGLELRADPTALAPERLIVFEVRGSVSDFTRAVQQVPGLELVDEEELDASDGDKKPVAYLLLPDVRALKNLESLWKRWQQDQLQYGETPWRHVFALLRDLRAWGPSDRVSPADAQQLEDATADLPGASLHRIEIELVFRANSDVASRETSATRRFIEAVGGRVIAHCRIAEIAYEAVLADVPVDEVRNVIAKAGAGLSGLDPVLQVRPQSVATSIEVGEAEPAPSYSAPQLRDPILALVDGVPVAAHPWLAGHVRLDDQFDLEPSTPAQQRVHGTTMASLIIHGDKNKAESPLTRQIHVVPVLGPNDEFPADRLPVDMVYTSVRRMREGAEATAPNIVIVNLSLGVRNLRFQGRMSAWARLLDRLAYEYGILFVVSAGNIKDPFEVPPFTTSTAFEDAAANARANAVFGAIAGLMRERKLLAPAETVNGITVGACNIDHVAQRAVARTIVDPYATTLMPNPTSALGQGFAASVKPDILMPGGREHLRATATRSHIEVVPAAATRAAGLKVAAPPSGAIARAESYTSGTSAAAALASRTAHQIHDALETAYPREFPTLSHKQKAVVLKALLAHTATWPDAAADLIRSVLHPARGHHSHVKDDIRRFLGFGVVDADNAVACAGDRATFWAVGELHVDRIAEVRIPVPAAIGGRADPHSLSATLAWFTPVMPGRKAYRSVRLRLIDPDDVSALGVRVASNQPDGNQTNRGTVFSRCWSGSRAPVVGSDTWIALRIQRDPDQGSSVDEAAPFGLAVTLAMPGVTEIYEQVRQRLRVQPRARIA